MSPFLLNLLQAGSALPADTALPETGADIQVMGRRMKGPTRQEKLIDADLRAAPKADGDTLKELIPRKGMFGVKGTLRDILGTVGDAFLVQSGNKAIYQPQRQRERAASAMYDFTANPLEAAERLAAQGFPDEAAELYKMAEATELKKATLQSQQDARQSQISERDYKRQQDFGNWAARILGGAQGDPARLQAALKIINQRAQKYNIDLEELGIDPELTPENAAIISRGDMTVNQQEQLPRRDRQLDIAERNAASGESRAASSAKSAEASMIRARKSGSGGRPANPTAASMAAPILKKIEQGGQITRGEREVLKRLGMSEDRGSGKKKRAIGAPPAAILQRLGIPAGGQMRKIN